MTQEKRKYERYELSGTVESKSIHILKGVNVSLSGIRVLTNRKLEIDHVVDMTFSMPGITNVFAAEAKVAWQKKGDSENNFDTGFVFNKINVDKVNE
ncbi:MAG: PilZ domain-containing protein [Deltaproteobacteria bacterium]|nr:PilZ domain-containing protein [Deltaproteobacteria bacterium]